MNTIQEFLEKKYNTDLNILETVHDIVSINELPKDKYTVDSNDKVHVQPMSDEEYEYHILSIYGKKDLSNTYNLLFLNIHKGIDFFLILGENRFDDLYLVKTKKFKLFS